MISACDQRLLDHASVRFLQADESRPPAVPYPGADRYVLASLLQKSIRRGEHETARRAGHQLLDLDPARLWRRLRVTALEDIGIGDPDAAAALMAVACLPEARRRIGGNARALDAALAAACNAVKDRTADHLGSITRVKPSPPPPLANASDAALIAAIASEGLDWTYRAHAAAILHQRFEPYTSGIRRAVLAPLFDLFRGIGTDELVLAACEAFAARERAALPLFVLLASSLSRSSETVHAIKTAALPAAQLIDGIPDYAFDPHHTRIGRRAVELWRRSHLAPPHWTVLQLRTALWNVEAAACDRRLDWPLGEEMRRLAYHADLQDRGVPEDEHSALYIWVAEALPALVCARQAAWRGTRAS